MGNARTEKADGINFPKLEQLCAVAENGLSVLLCSILSNNVQHEFLAAFTAIVKQGKAGKDSLNCLQMLE